MIDTKNIYRVIDKNIVEQGYWQADIDEKKELVNKELKKYTLYQISLLNITLENKEYTIEELVQILVDNIEEKDHYELLGHFIHYILQIASDMQNFYICWYGIKDESLIENPEAKFDEYEIWTELNIDVKTSFMTTFKFVNDIFNNKFKTKNKQKQLEQLK